MYGTRNEAEVEIVRKPVRGAQQDEDDIYLSERIVIPDADNVLKVLKMFTSLIISISSMPSVGANCGPSRGRAF